MKTRILYLAISALITTNSALAAPHGMVYKQGQQQIRSIVEIDAVMDDSRTARAPKLQYYGGPVLSAPKVYAVYWGSNVNSDTRSQIGGFFTSTLNSTYMDWLKEYNTNILSISGQQGTNQTIGRGTFAGDITIKPSTSSNNLQDADIQTELDKQITSGALPKPDANSLYMIFFPPGVGITIDGQASCQVFCAYHEGFKSNTNGNVFYGVMPDQGGSCALGCGQEQSAFDNLTAVTAHEMIEATTDPFPTPASSPAFPQAWNASDGSEIGDLCAGNNTQVVGRDRTYIVQQEFDNSINDCAPGPYKAP